MLLKPGQTLNVTFTTRSATGAATNADSTPTAIAFKNGAVDAGFVLTVTSTGTVGHYKITGTVPAGYVAGDMFDIMVTATVGGVLDRASKGPWQIDTKRTSDIPAAPTVVEIRNEMDANSTKLANMDAAITSRAPASTALSSAQWTNTRAGLLDRLDAAISTRSTYAGADTPGTATLLSRITGAVPLASDYTPARAAKLDNIDALISSRMATFAYTAPDSAATIAAAVWGSAGRTLTASMDPTAAQIASAVWNEPRAGHVTAGTFGFYLDAQISGVSGGTGGGATAAQIWDYLTANSATAGSFGKLVKDNLDAKITSRSTYAGADTPGTGTLLTRITGAVPLASDWTAARAGKLDNLDVAVGSRMATFAYTAPDNAGIGAIRAKTDNLPAQPAAVGSAMTLAANSITAATVAADAVTKIQNGLFMASSYIAPDNAKIITTNASVNSLVGYAVLWDLVIKDLDMTMEGDPAEGKRRFTAHALSNSGISGVVNKLDNVNGNTNFIASISGRLEHTLKQDAESGEWRFRDLPTYESLFLVRDEILESIPDDYQRSGVAVTLPDPAPEGYGGAFEGEVNALTPEQSAQLSAIYTRTAGGAVFTLPVTDDGGMIVIDRWNDYAAEDGRKLTFKSAGWPELIAGEVLLKIGSALAIPGVIEAPDMVSFELSREETSRMLPGSFEIEATISGRKITLSRGTVKVNDTLQND